MQRDERRVDARLVSHGARDERSCKLHGAHVDAGLVVRVQAGHVDVRFVVRACAWR
jgi:hypothetical protein